MKWQDYIVPDNEILLGKSTIKGTQIFILLTELPLAENSCWRKIRFL
jgi:hypothetical protein